MSEPTPMSLIQHGDKSLWGDGPWVGEPDRVEFEVAGFPTLVRRGIGGAWCGYVGVPPAHPWFGKDYDEIGADVHGGLTYARECDEHPEDGVCHLTEDEDTIWWLGFDCGHCGDVLPAMDYRLRQALGEDRPSLADLSPWPVTYKDLAYVVGEITSLALQAQAAT